MKALFQSAQHLYENREGSGAGFETVSGSVFFTNGSGSGRPKNMRIRFGMRIPNTYNTSWICFFRIVAFPARQGIGSSFISVRIRIQPIITPSLIRIQVQGSELRRIRIRFRRCRHTKAELTSKYSFYAHPLNANPFGSISP